VLLGLALSAAAEYLGGIIMVVTIALIFRLTLTTASGGSKAQRACRARRHSGRMEGHAAMDMSVEGGGRILPATLQAGARPSPPSAISS